jgi:biopolymer transport protein ExbB/TolQ
MNHLFTESAWPIYPLLFVALSAVAVATIQAFIPLRALRLTALGLGIAVPIFGIFGTTLGLTRTFAAVAGVDPSMKAALLAQGISEAMSCSVLGWGSVLVWLVPFFVGVIRGRSQPGA